MFGASEKGKMVTEHKILDSYHLIACLAMSYQLRAWLWLVVSGKQLNTGNGILGNIKGRKEANGASGPFHPAFLRM